MAQNKTKSDKSLAKINKLKPDSWEIAEENGINNLIFYRGENILSIIPILPETMGNIMVELSSHLIVEGNMADSWTYRQPEDKSLPDFFTLIKGGKIIGTLPIDYKTGKKIYQQMQKYSSKPSIIKQINMWRKKHKIAFVSTIILLSVILGSIVATFISKLFVF